MREATGRGLLDQAIAGLRDGLLRNTVGRRRALDPRVLQVNVNERCNARCAMCNIWRRDEPVELSLAQYAEILADPLFRKVEYVCLSGGEPTLRRDLPEIAAQVQDALPRLRQISIPTTGIATERSLRVFAPIARECAARGVDLAIAVSLDATGPLYDRVRGVPGGYAKVIATLIELKKLKQDVEFQLGLHPTLTAMNAHEAPALARVGRELDLEVHFILGIFLETYYRNADLRENLSLSRDDAHTLERFLADEGRRQPLLAKDAYYYEQALAMIGGARRTMPCPYADRGVVLEPTGELAYCLNSRPVGCVHERPPSAIYRDPANLAYRRALVEQTCPGCEVSCFVGVGLRSAPAELASFAMRRLRSRLRDGLPAS